jgi:hypothetical protein
VTRTENRVFFPQEALDQWIVDATVDLHDGELTIVAEGRRFRLAEAVRVLREVSETSDPHELVGRVKARAYLEQLGAEIVESSMLLGDAAYDVEPGWIGLPVGTFGEHLASDARRRARTGKSEGDPKTDEELLARFLEENL